MEPQQNSKEKSLAWFKLADLIARGEREKALNVFRLLAHSLPDRAYVLQLEGDILWYFDDKNFTEKYKQAAFLYQKDKRWIDAIAIYEHLLTHNPNSYQVMSSLIVFYIMVNWPEKTYEISDRLVQLFSSNIINEFQLETTIKDITQSILALENEPPHSLVNQWFAHMMSIIPDTLIARLRGLL